VFVVASAAIVVVDGVVLSSILSRALSDQAVADRRVAVAHYVDGVLGPVLVREDRLSVGPHVSARLEQELRRDRDLVTVKVWRADGVLAWTNRGQSRIGRRFELEGDLEEAIRELTPAGHIDELSAGEDGLERSLGFDHLLEVYVPIL
jgi:hypothetical protein